MPDYEWPLEQMRWHCRHYVASNPSLMEKIFKPGELQTDLKLAGFTDRAIEAYLHPEPWYLTHYSEDGRVKDWGVFWNTGLRKIAQGYQLEAEYYVDRGCTYCQNHVPRILAPEAGIAWDLPQSLAWHQIESKPDDSVRRRFFIDGSAVYVYCKNQCIGMDLIEDERQIRHVPLGCITKDLIRPDFWPPCCSCCAAKPVLACLGSRI